MNRFRELKEKLIKSKRDSQKLQQLPFTETELEDWVQKELEYYGISKDSYRLKQLKNYAQPVDSDIGKQNPQHQSSRDSVNAHQSKEKAFVKKVGSVSSSQFSSNQKNDMSFGQESGQLTQKEQLKQNNHENIQRSSRRLICKKPKNQHVSSMNDAEKIIQNINQFKNNQFETKNQFKSCQPQSNGMESLSPQKELDYYTLILQLTAELNYSRINKESSNEKSILNQIKNLISYIESKSATETGTQSAQLHSHNIRIESQTNKKSNHTFSSVFSNESMTNEMDNNEESGGQNNSEQRKIKYKLIGQEMEIESLNTHRIVTEPRSSQRHNQHEDQHNQTFQSINAFEQHESQNPSDEEQEKTSIIDMVNDQQNHSYRDDIFIQEGSEHYNSIIENSPLSRITERQSEYRDSVNPSINVSPSKYTPDKLTRTGEKSEKQSHFIPHLMEKHIESLYAENLFKKQPSSTSEKDSASNRTKIFPQNELILKKLSDRLDNTEESHHLFEQSLEYKRILYMLDSEYGNSDYKNRTFSSLFGGQKSSSTPHQCGSDKENCHYSIKRESEESAKSFAKEIFESEQSCQKNHHTKENPCLMNKLDNLFKSECKKQTSSPKLLHFSSQSELEAQQNQSQFNKMKNHKRSKTTCETFSMQKMNKTMKYRFNVLSSLSQQINEESEENAFDNNKYEPMRTQYDEDSVYHKVSRHSYLTSSSAQNSNEPTSSESQMDGKKKAVKKGNLIVKKNKKTEKENLRVRESDDEKLEKQMKFIVKKKPIQSIKNQKAIDKFNKEISNNESQLFTKRPQSQEVIFISMSNEATSRATKSINSLHNSTSSQSSNQKDKEPIVNNKIRSPSLNDSKVSVNSSRQIKYKVYASRNQFHSTVTEKQDKRKVLKDIVSVLNTKYNRNIKLKE